MKKLFLIISLLFLTMIVKAQNQYINGFTSGYRKGYCYGIGVGCIATNPPILPVPSIGENPESYQDGYNKGFLAGLQAQKQELNTAQGQHYKTTAPELIDFIHKIDLKSVLEQATAIKQLKGIAFENYQNKEYNTCIYLSSKLLSQDPYDGELYSLIGMSYYSLKDYEKALFNLKKEKEYEPSNGSIDRVISIVEKEYRASKN